MPLETEPFNPLSYDNLAKAVVSELMGRGPFLLPPEHSFVGEGVYAIFYEGNLPWYAKVSSCAANTPIYVGKASVPGVRKGDTSSKPSKALHKRLSEHAESIRCATNLQVDQFRCRYLVVDGVWISLAEEFLIRHYRPVWNCCLDGFGNHNPGSGRHQGEITWWDAMHPGRPWATQLRQTKTQQEAVEMVQNFFLQLQE